MYTGRPRLRREGLRPCRARRAARVRTQSSATGSPGVEAVGRLGLVVLALPIIPPSLAAPMLHPGLPGHKCWRPRLPSRRRRRGGVSRLPDQLRTRRRLIGSRLSGRLGIPPRPPLPCAPGILECRHVIPLLPGVAAVVDLPLGELVLVERGTLWNHIFVASRPVPASTAMSWSAQYFWPTSNARVWRPGRSQRGSRPRRPPARRDAQAALERDVHRHGARCQAPHDRKPSTDVCRGKAEESMSML